MERAHDSDPLDAFELPAEFLRRLPQRDEEALVRFFDVYLPKIYGYVRRLVRDEHLAEDLTQDIFVHLHRAFPTYDPTRDLRPWVFTIASNKVRDFWRSRRHKESQKESSVERDGAVDSLSAGAQRPHTAMATRELDANVRQAIEDLPEGLRMTVVLRIYEGLSFEAIGKILDRNEVAIRKRYSRALEALREALAGPFELHVDGNP